MRFDGYEPITAQVVISTLVVCINRWPNQPGLFTAKWVR